MVECLGKACEATLDLQPHHRQFLKSIIEKQTAAVRRFKQDPHVSFATLLEFLLQEFDTFKVRFTFSECAKEIVHPGPVGYAGKL